MSISKAKLQRCPNLYSSDVAAKTRLSSLAQLSRTGRWCAQVASHSAGAASWAAGLGTCGSACGSSCGTTSARSLALVASTPWFAKRGSAHFAKRSYADTNADQMQPRPGRPCGQPLHELQRRHHQLRGPVAPSCLELEHHLPGGVGLHAFVGQCRARDVAAQLLQRLAVFGRAAHRCVQAEALAVGTQRLLEILLPGHGARRKPGARMPHSRKASNSSLTNGGRSAPAVASAWAMKVAACCCARRYGVVCSGR